VLMKLMEQMVKKDAKVLGNKELILVERFVDCVQHGHLKSVCMLRRVWERRLLIFDKVYCHGQ
jgi:hypothetical protein